MMDVNEESDPVLHPNTSQAIERIILARPVANLSSKQISNVVESGRVLITAIPGVEQMSFGRSSAAGASHPWYVRIRFRDEQALQNYETHPNHINFGTQQWLPVIADQIVIDYALDY
jgi:hypothetical protein